ncbi:MAG: extracellular solute-binding protein [bacterium]|nr:extracellular solute-binding protein [bacterium]
MRKKKRMAALGMAAAVLASVLAGCGGKTTEDAGTTAAQTAGEEQKEPLKFTYSITHANLQFAVQAPDINDTEWVKAFNETFHVEATIKLLDQTRMGEEMQQMFASGEVPDIVRMYDNYLRTDMCGSVEKGVFMPLDDLLVDAETKYPNLMKMIPRELWENNRYNGKIYGIPNVFLSNNSRRAVYIRKDLLDKAGLDIPDTLDDMVEVLRAFKDMGIEYPYAGRQGWGYTDVFFDTFGVHPSNWNLDENGDLTPDFIKPQMKEALEFQKMLREEGLMDPETLTTSSSEWTNKIAAGKVGMFDHNANALATWNANLKANVPDGELILIQAPLGPYGDRGMFKYSPVMESTYINKNFKEPERFLEFLDLMCTEEAQRFLDFGIEGRDYNLDANGNVVDFEYPADDAYKISELNFRRKLGFVYDDTFPWSWTPYMEAGEEVVDWLNNIGSKEGIRSINPGKLKSLETMPELNPSSCDLFYEMAAKIFYGQDTETTFDDFVNEWLERGGKQLIEEANENYKAGNVYIYE